MKKIYPFLFVLSFILILQNNVFAQAPFTIGIKGGVSIPNLRSSGDNLLDKGWKSRSGPYLGLVAEVNLSDFLAITAEINYSSQGGKRTGTQAIPNPSNPPIPPYLYADFKNIAIINYVEVPLMTTFKFALGSSTHLLVQSGVYGGFLLRGKNVSSGEGMLYLDENLSIPVTPVQSFDHTTDIKDQIKSFNYGLQIGLGLSVDFNTSSLRLMGGANYGLTSIQKDPVNGNDHTGALTVSLAYLLDL
ncbi:MAG: porin family protein [Chitinophagaceae bacterium]